MNDISFQIGLDIQQALSDLDKLKTSIKQSLSQNADSSSVKGLATEFGKVSQAARSSMTEQKQALAALIASGKTGSAAYNELVNSLKASQTEASKLEQAMKKVDNVLTETPAKSKSLVSSLSGVGGTILGVFGGGALLGGVQGMVGGFKEIVEKGLAAENRANDLKIAFSQAGLQGEVLAKQLKSSGEEASIISQRFGVTKGAVADVQKQAALLGGTFGEQNKRLTELAVGIEAVTRGEISTTDVIKAFTKGGAEGSESLGRLTQKFPALADQLKGIKDPAEKSQKALDFLKGSFDQFSDSPTVAIARLKNSFSSLVGGIAVNVIQLFKPLLEILDKTLVPALQTVAKWIKSAFETFTPLAPIISGIAAGVIALTIATTAWTAAQWLLNSSIIANTAALLANPIGLIIAGIVALGVALVVAYNKFEGFRNVVNGVWDAITAGAKIMWSFISNYFMVGFDTIKSIVGTALKVVSAIMKGDFTGAWDNLKNGATEVGGVIQNRVTNVVKDTASAVGEVGKKQAEHTEAAKKTSQQVREIITSVKDLSDEMVKAGNKFMDAFDVQKNKAKFIYQIKQLSDEQYKTIYEASDAQGKKALEAARFANDQAVKAEQNAAKTYQNIINKNKKSEEEFSKLIGENADKMDKSRKEAVKAPDISKEIDSTNKVYTELQNITSKTQEEILKIASEKRIKDLETLKDVTAKNELLIGSERLGIIANIENQIAETKYQKDLELKNKELELERKQITDKANLAVQDLRQRLVNNAKETDQKKKLSAEQVQSINDQILLLQNQLNSTLLQLDGKYYTQLGEIDSAFQKEQATRTKDNNKKIQDEISKEKINQIQNISERQLAIDLQSLKKSFEAKLKDVKGNYKLELDAYIEYLAQKDALENESARKASSQAAKLATDITQILQRNAQTLDIKPVDNSKDIAAENQKYADSRKKFEQDLKDKKISYETYLKEIAKLESDHSAEIKKLQGSQVDGWKIVAELISKTFTDLANKKAEDVRVMLKGYDDVNSAIRQQTFIVKDAERSKTLDAQKYQEEFTKLSQMQQKHAEILAQVYQATGEQVGAAFVGMVASGQNAGKALAKAALSGLKSLVPILIAEIFGQSLAQLGPIGGAIAAAGLSAVFYGLIAVAEASIGAETGYLPGQKLGKKGRTDTQLIWFNPKEAIISEQNYARNKSIIDSIQMYGHPGGFNDNNIVKELQMTRQELAKHKSVEVYDRRVIDINDNRSVQVRSANLYR